MRGSTIENNEHIDSNSKNDNKLVYTTDVIKDLKILLDLKSKVKSLKFTSFEKEQLKRFEQVYSEEFVDKFIE